MNFMSWNCRGTAAKGFTSLVRDLRKEYDYSLIFLLETHASGDKALRQAKKTGFGGQFIVDANGHSGGIWCLWDVGYWNVDVINNSNQFVHMKVTWKGSISWLITVVYASTRYVRRQELWENLVDLDIPADDPWVVLGDFNAILAKHERRGGSSNFSVRGMNGFREMVQSCNLLDVGFQGNLFQRLDRVFCNLAWRLKFPSAAIIHLPFFKSDHRVVIVRMKKKFAPNRKRRPFRFLASWLHHEDFPHFMSCAWPRAGQWCNQINSLHGALDSWNKQVFGDIFARKRRLVRRLENVANRLTSVPSVELELAHKRIWGEYEQVLIQEEMLWFQKSRSKWLMEGDRNTRFFHGVTAIRRRKNSIDLLQDRDGNWVGDPSRLEEMVSNYFKSYFPLIPVESNLASRVLTPLVVG